MEQKTKTKKKQKKAEAGFAEAIGLKPFFESDILGGIIGIALCIVAVYMVIAFVSYFSTAEADQSLVLDLKPGEWTNTGREFKNACGSMGALISHFFIARCFGIPAFIIPVLLLIIGLRLSKAYTSIYVFKWFLALVVIMLWCSVTFAKFVTPIMGDQVYNPGGDHGAFVCQWLEGVIGSPGLIATLGIVALIFLTYISSETIVFLRKLLNPVGFITNKVKFHITNTDGSSAEAEMPKQETVAGQYEDSEPSTIDLTDADDNSENSADSDATTALGGTKAPFVKSAAETAEVEDMTVTVAAEGEKATSKSVQGDAEPSTPINPKEPFLSYKYPTLDLLKRYDTDSKPYIDMKEQTANKNRIIEVLNSFGVKISSITATVGPTITLYELTPAEGVRISKIRNLEDDIALSLSALGIRIIAPIPGKGTIGIEVPNAKANIVSMEGILNSRKFQETTMELPLALGKTITNDVFMVDLAKIPHLLVAGATGQGKSVGLNAIITSLLYKKHPNELKFVLVDPKKVEFSVYSPIVNHFMAQIPDDTGDEEAIITDVTKVIRTLNSLCKLMDHRYDLLKMAGVRNIKEYNQKFVNRRLRLTDGHEYMPYIVVIIDEFGDLIMTAGKEIELPIARIAQLARAVGIHMVIATQRPTTRIITGNIKANFPGRIAFKVSSRIDSMTILDRTGANQLIGRGDMLYSAGSDPVRVQCAFVDTPEVERINKYIQEQPGPVEPLELPEPSTDEGGAGNGAGIDSHNLDPMFEEAAHAIVLSQQGSTSMIQRRFAIGYNRAGRLMDQLEEAGIVGPAQGSKPRDVLITDITSLDNLLASIRG